jgi:Mn-dependent DtxR family transcriptional regulator
MQYVLPEESMVSALGVKQETIRDRLRQLRKAGHIRSVRNGQLTLYDLRALDESEGRAKGRKRAQFARIPETVLRAPRTIVPDGEFHLYCRLARYIPHNNSRSTYFAGIKTLASDLRVHERTITRRLDTLRDVDLIREIQKGGRTIYEVRAFESSPAGVVQTKAPDCPWFMDDLSSGGDPKQDATQQADADLAQQQDTEREPDKENHLNREVQACTLFDYQSLFDVGFSRKNASALVAEYEPERVAEAVSHVGEQENVANPAGLITAFLSTNVWEQEHWLEKYLLHMPEPRRAAEYECIAGDLIAEFGSAPSALAALKHLQRKERETERCAAEDSQHELVARIVASRVGDASHFVSEYVRSHREEREDAPECITWGDIERALEAYESQLDASLRADQGFAETLAPAEGDAPCRN